MDAPQSSSSSHQYPQAIQLKLYQAFIFSIPILFSIILFLLFYLFYLKRRALNASTTPPVLPRTTRDSSGQATTSFDQDLKGELKTQLTMVLFDEHMKARDTVCCVCLGEFEMIEELLQVASCKHVFHVDCIRHWLQSHSTCPLCRVSVYSNNNNQLNHELV